MFGVIVGHYGRNPISISGWGIFILWWVAVLLSPHKPKT